ncbi:MAG: hypothetical protein IH946_07905 [Bacteroidetes bacterium]|nr:hypothetical protein [Bacteroidota bacterium]
MFRPVIGLAFQQFFFVFPIHARHVDQACHPGFGCTYNMIFLEKNFIAAEDTLYIFRDRIRIMVPKGFNFSIVEQGNITALIILKEFPKGRYVLTLTEVITTSGLSFDNFTTLSLKNYTSTQDLEYEVSQNPETNCRLPECKEYIYNASRQGITNNTGILLYFHSDIHYYQIMSAGLPRIINSLSEEQEKIIQSIRILNPSVKG